MIEVDFQRNSRTFFEQADKQVQELSLPFLQALTSGFSVSWFKQTDKKTWMASLKPQRWVRDRFGLLYEYILIGNHYFGDFHVRTLEERVDDRIADRIDRQLRFVASEAPGIKDICARWARDKGVSVIVLSEEDVRGLLSTVSRQEALEQTLASSLWVRDRFDDSEPVRTPGEFFGREALVNDCVHRLRTGLPMALMGLRKIGKSSVLRRVEARLLGADDFLVISSFVSCNGSDIKGSHWSYLCRRIIEDWKSAVEYQGKQAGRKVNTLKVRSVEEEIKKGSRVVDRGAIARALNADFSMLFKTASYLSGNPDSVRFVVFFDEADHLNPEATDAPFWTDGFFDFWDTFQAMKRGHTSPGALSWMIGGVNPAILESGAFGDRPNPLFETPVEYLCPMEFDEAYEMMNGLGLPMGLTFARDAVEDIFAMTGGHPWLLRKAGSIVHKKNRKRSGALDVTAKKCSHALAGAKASFLNHIDWILTHLARIAPDEHALLRDICVQGPKVYDEDWQDREFREVFAQHLEDYGLLDFSDDLPRVAVPLVSEVFSKQASGGYGLEKRRLREAVDGLESAIRSRLLNDLQYPADIVWDETPADEDAEIDAGRMSSPEWRTQEQVVEIIIRAVDSKAKNRPKGRDELRDLGMTKGLAALLESLNWEDYILVIEKNFPSIRTKGTTAEVDDFIKELRETVVFVHLVRHNNDAELKEEISQRGFAGCMGLIMQCQSYFAD